LADLYETDPEQFRLLAISIWESEDDPELREQLTVMLVVRSGLNAILGQPKVVSLAAAQRAMRLAGRVDPRAESSFLQEAIARCERDPAGGAPRLIWALEVLAGLPSMERFLPQIAKLIEHPDPAIGSKAVLLAGQSMCSPVWLADHLRNPSPRVRANAIEAIWGHVGEQHRELLTGALEDRHNRVAANAALALYFGQEPAGIRALYAMGEDPDRMLRGSAAWAMGQTEDPRFRFALRRLADDPEPNVARLVRRLKVSTADGAPPGWVLSARLRGRSARLAVLGPGGVVKALTLRQVAGFQNERPVLPLRIAPLRVDGPPVVGIAAAKGLPEEVEELLPAASHAAASTLTHWGVLRFREPIESQRLIAAVTGPVDELLLKQGKTGLEYQLRRSQDQQEPVGDLLVAAIAMIEVIRRQPGERHLLIVPSDNPEGGLLAEGLAERIAAVIASAKEESITIHAVVPSRIGRVVQETLGDLVEGTGGLLSKTGPGGADLAFFERLFLLTRPTHRIDWEPVPDVSVPLRLEVYLRDGMLAGDLG
jgi:HEAT repeat protein